MNLAGEPVVLKLDAQHRDAVMRSRVEVTRAVADAIGASRARGAGVNASAVAYGPRGDEELGEDEPPGDDSWRGCASRERRARAHGARGGSGCAWGWWLGEAGGVLERWFRVPLFAGGPSATGVSGCRGFTSTTWWA